MRVLVLGGTVFCSRAIAAAALRGGHDVVCAARGASGAPPEGAALVTIDRNVPGSLEPLRGERFDAVVDVATMSLGWVRDALDVLAPTSGHWTFVSSINAYSDTTTRGRTAAAPLLEPLLEAPAADAPDVDPNAYGAIKVASEDAVRATTGDRALVVRGGLMCGPGDVMDRFGYWANRFARGGRVVVPDVPGHPAQIVDVRDLAEWIVRCAEAGTGGTFDGTAPATTLAAMLEEVAEAVGAPDLELAGLPAETLAEAGVGVWAGPRSLPLWLPESHWGIADRDVTATLAAGFTARSVADSARAALEWEKTLGLDRERRAGLTGEEEASLLASA
jgi:2'-hydroxyisoflavone reductase